MTRATFRDPAARERAWGLFYRKRGTARAITRSTRPLSADERRARWAYDYELTRRNRNV